MGHGASNHVHEISNHKSNCQRNLDFFEFNNDMDQNDMFYNDYGSRPMISDII